MDLARSVCTDWFTIIDKRSFTLFCMRIGDHNSIENVFSRYETPFELRFKKTISADAHLLNCLARLTNLVSLSLITNHHLSQPMLALKTLSNLKQLKLEDPPMSLIEKLPQLNKLHLIRAYQFMAYVHVFSTLTSLQDLKITLADHEDYSGLLSAIPNPSLLTRLKFNGSNMSDYAAIQRFYNMKHLTLDYWSTKFEENEPFPLKFSALESLTVNSTNVSLEDITNNTTLTHLVLGGVNCPSLENFSRLTKLQTLSFAALNTPSSAVEDEQLEFLTSLSALQKLTLDEATGKFTAYLLPYLTSFSYGTYNCKELHWMQLENLRELSLEVQSIEDNENLLLNMEKASKLTRLELKVNSLSTEIAQKLPTTLRELNLSTGATSVIEIDLTRLKELNMITFNNVIVDPLCLVQLSDLTALNHFSVNWWQPELLIISSLQNLTYLNLAQDDTEMASAILPVLTNLRELCISPLSDNTIRQLTALKHLTYLMCIRLESEGNALTCLTSLQRLIAVPNLKNSQETKAAVKSNLIKALPNLISILV